MLVVLLRGTPSCKSFKLEEKATRGGQSTRFKVKSRVLIIHMDGQHNVRILVFGGSN